MSWGRRQELIEDVGGAIHLDVPEPYRPTGTPTVTLSKPGGATLQAATSCANDPVTTTLSGAHAAGSTTLTLADNTGVEVRRVYVLRNADGQYEWVRIRRVDSGGADVDIDEELEFVYADGDTCVGNRLTYTVSGALAGTSDEGYRALWTYVANGVTHYVSTLFDVVKSKWPDPILRPDEYKRIVGERGSDAFQRPEDAGWDFADAIDRASENVYSDLKAAGLTPSKFISFDSFKLPVARRVALDLALDGSSPPAYAGEPQNWLEICQKRYGEDLQRAISSTRSYDEDGDDAVSTDEAERKHPLIRFEW